MAWRFKYRGNANVPVEVDCLIPSRLRGLGQAEVERIPIAVGNRELPAAELFAIERLAGVADGTLRVDFEGDLAGVHWIGAKLDAGQIHVEGSVGRHVGSEMSAGRIEIRGNASDWAGAECRGGLIHVHGNAGHHVGAAYRGSRRGMTGGCILIDGSAGNEIGHTMRRGLIAVCGDAGDLIGFNMLAGTILVFGRVGIRHGAGMKRGTIGLLGDVATPLLPSFRRACHYQPLMLELVLRHLRLQGFRPPETYRQHAVDLYNGDLIAGGRGEVLLAASPATPATVV